MARVRKNISVDQELWQLFEQRCALLGNKMSNRLELLITEDLEEVTDE